MIKIGRDFSDSAKESERRECLSTSCRKEMDNIFIPKYTLMNQNCYETGCHIFNKIFYKFPMHSMIVEDFVQFPLTRWSVAARHPIYNHRWGPH